MFISGILRTSVCHPGARDVDGGQAVTCVGSTDSSLPLPFVLLLASGEGKTFPLPLSFICPQYRLMASFNELGLLLPWFILVLRLYGICWLLAPSDPSSHLLGVFLLSGLSRHSRPVCSVPL